MSNACSCSRQCVPLKSFNKGFQVNTNPRLSSTKLLWKRLQNATMLQHHGKRCNKWPIKLHIKRCDVGYPICQLTGLQRPSDAAWYMAGEHLYSVDSWDAFLNLTSRSFCHIYHKWLETSAKISLDPGDGIGLSPIPLAGFAPQQIFLPDFVQSRPQYLVKKAFPGFSPGLASTPHISRLHYKIQ